MPSRPLPTTPQVAWDTPALFGVGLVEDDAGAAALYQELHTPLAAAGVDGVKVCSLVITPVQVGCDLVAAALRREGCNPAHSRVPSLQPYATVAPPSSLNRWTCSLA